MPASHPLPDPLQDLKAAFQREARAPFASLARQVDPAAVGLDAFRGIVEMSLSLDMVGLARELVNALPEGARGSEGWKELVSLLSPAVVRFGSPASQGPADQKALRWRPADAAALAGQWVALRGDQVLGAAPTLPELRAKLGGFSSEVHLKRVPR